MPQPKRVKPGDRIPFRLTARERDLVLERTFIDPELEKRLRLAVASGSQIVIGLTLDDVDELAGAVAAEANHCNHPKTRRVLDAVYDRLARLEAEFTDQEPEAHPAKSAATQPAPAFTAKQGQYLAFIYYYAKIHGTPPAEADMQGYFRVSPPAVHQMILTLEARGLIERVPGQARSIRLRVSKRDLPALE